MNDARAAVVKAREHAGAGRADQARALLTRALQRWPDDPLANFELARMLERPEPERARYFLDRAARGAPADAGPLCEIGKVFMRLGDRARARSEFERAARAQPGSPVAHGALAALDMLERRFASAVRECRVGLEHAPGQPDLANTRGMALLSMGRVDEAIEWLSAAAARPSPDHLIYRSNLALACNYSTNLTASQVLGHHAAYAAALAAVVPGRPPAPARAGPPAVSRRLTVGWLSPDFLGHSVEYFIRPVLEHLERSRFRVVCFSTAPDRLGDERRRPACDAWRDVSALGLAQLDAAIRAESCDILVELSGHTMGNRLPLLRLRPAPLIVTYLGYPNTTGLDEVRARLVDARTDPTGAPSAGPESLVRLDPCFLCYAASPGAPPPAPADPARPVVFGSFNALSKINDGVMRLWARIVNAVPGASLLLKAAGLAEEEVRADVRDRFRAAGLGSERLEFAGWTEGHAEHMALYNRVDIGLDPFPYNGTTTTAEALWMGVPVVTIEGERHAGRVGVSLLHAAGLPELVARTPEEYAAVAVGLAMDRERLAGLRSSLRDRLARSVLCDGPAMGRRLGDALWSLWLEQAGAKAAG